MNFHVLSLQITGPRQSPRIDKPHPASIARTRPAVAWCTWKKIAQMMRNCPCVTNTGMCAMQEDHRDQGDHRTHHRQLLPLPFIFIRWKRWNMGHCIMHIIQVKRIIAIIAVSHLNKNNMNNIRLTKLMRIIVE